MAGWSRWTCVGVVAISLARVSAAQTDGQALAREHAQQATIQYNLGKFEEALAEYSKAYELIPLPELLFNIGQCHFQLKNYERAIFFYKGFLRESPDSDVARDRIRESQSALDAAREKADRLQASTPTGDASPQREAPRLRVSESATSTAQTGLVLGRSDRDRRLRDQAPFYERWWFWVAVGGVSATVGVIAALSAGDSEVVLPMGSVGVVDQR